MSLGLTNSSTGEACPLEGVPRGHSSRDVCAVHIKGNLPTSSCLARDTHTVSKPQHYRYIRMHVVRRHLLYGRVRLCMHKC